MGRLLEIENLNVRFGTRDGEVGAVNDVSLGVSQGECLGIVGESGSGKSQTFLAVLGLLARNGRATGAVRFEGRDILGAKPRALRDLRGNRIAMVFQDPMTSLTPHMRIGRQLAEVLTHHKGLEPRAAREKAAAMLARVRIPDAAARLDMYPHEFSGGMRQRVMIAMALLTGPELLICDEPTTALDVTVQAQILKLILDMKRTSSTAIVVISHNLGVIAGLCDRVAVMYAGEVVEEGPAEAIFASPQHPYTRGLLASMPRFDEADKPLVAIPGQPPDLLHPPKGCPFTPRCPHAFARCRAEHPALGPVEGAKDRRKACHLKGFGAAGEVLA